MSEDQELSIQEHLEELRTRLIRSALAILIAIVPGWIFRRDILYILKKPLLDALPEEMRHTILLKVIDKFFIDLKVALIGALFIASPFVIAQIWGFIAPGLYANERRIALPGIIFASLLFAGGVTFCYFIVLPFGFQFLVDYSIGGGDLLLSGGVLPEAAGAADKLQIALKEHITLTAGILLAFGIAFQTPLFMLVLGMTGLIPAEKFAKARRYALVGIFVFAAMLTPPDPWSQISLALPLVFLYEVGIWLVKLLGKKKEENAEEG